VNWPAIIKHSDDAELVYVRDQTAWNHGAELHGFDYDEADCLIDASGEIFALTNRGKGHIKPQPSGKAMTLPEILGLIKAHAAQTGSCCVAKLYAPTIRDAFKIVESLEEK